MTLTIISTLLLLIVLYLLFKSKIDSYQIKILKKEKLRILSEDALKYIYDCEFNDSGCISEDLKNELNISKDLTIEIINNLKNLELIKIDSGHINLTAEGKSNALKIIRIHRLLESYMANETDIEPNKWHSVAHELEHKTTISNAEELAAKLGNPIYDPHGAPIPSVNGEIHHRKGKPLTEYDVGTIGKIVYLEDEPENIYNQLLAQGLHHGMQIEIISIEPKRIRFIADGNECYLAPTFANNILIDPIKKESQIVKNFQTLDSLKLYETAKVIRISEKCRGQQRRRLMDFGFVPGAKVKKVMQSTFGDPTAFYLKGSTVALRKEHTQLIFIERNYE